MKQLEDTSIGTAALVLDIVPLVMRTIRAEMRRARPADISVPQFRALLFISRNPGTSLSDVAAHIGLTLPSLSKMVDGLVAHGLVTRTPDATDRRRLTLVLTAHGEATLHTLDSATAAHLAEMLRGLDPAQQAIVAEAMRLLQPIFTPDGSGSGDPSYKSVAHCAEDSAIAG